MLWCQERKDTDKLAVVVQYKSSGVCVESCNPGEINWEDFGRESPESGWPGYRDAGDMLSPSRACNRDLVDEEGPCGMVWGEVRASHGVPRRTDQQTKSWLGNSLCALHRSGRARDGGS